MIQVLEKFLALSFSLMILGNAYLTRKMVGTWLFPACFYSLFWFGFTFLPLLFVFTVPADPLAIAYILLSTIAFTISLVPFDWKNAFKINKKKIGTSKVLYNNLFLTNIFYTITILSFVFLIINSLNQGITVYDLLFNFYKSSGKYVEMRYSDEIKINIFGQLSLVLTYVGASIGGLLYGHASTKINKLKIVFLSFLSSIFIILTQSARGAFFLCVVLFFAGTLINKIFDNKVNFITKKTIKILIYSLLVMAPIVAISFISKGLYKGYDNEFILKRLIYYFASYSFGHIYAFSDWFSSYIGNSSSSSYLSEDISYGFYTFTSVFKLLGSNKETIMGTFGEYFNYKELLTTNIYTIYRGLILDFGLIGSLIYMIITGFFFHFTFYKMMMNNKPITSVAIFFIMIGYFINSFFISLFMWNSVYITFALLFFVLLLNKLFNNYSGCNSLSGKNGV
jgi:oligosaccharide repeat unit polymerase